MRLHGTRRWYHGAAAGVVRGQARSFPLTHRTLRSAAIYDFCLATRCISAQAQNGSRRQRRATRTNSVTGDLSPELRPLVEATERLRSACSDNDIKAAITSYGQLRTHHVLDGQDVTSLVRLLLAIRNDEAARTGDEQTGHLAMFAKSLVRDFQAGLLPPNHAAATLLLVFFERVGDRASAESYWEWLSSRPGNEHISLTTCAAYMDLLAKTRQPLQTIEELFESSISRYGDTFMGYHLSNNAVLRDPGEVQPVPNVARSLLRSMASARLDNGATIDAYLALDTMLRLLPAAHAFETFAMTVVTRPVTESYKLLHLSCLYDRSRQPHALNRVLYQLRSAVGSDLGLWVIATRAGLRGLYATFSAGNGFVTRNVNEMNSLILAIFNRWLFPRAGYAALSESVSSWANKLFDMFTSCGVPPPAIAIRSNLRALIDKGRMYDLVNHLPEAATGSLAQPDAFREAVEVAGWRRNRELVDEAWRRLVENKHHHNTEVSSGEVRLLSKALIHCGVELDAVKAAMQQYGGIIDIDRAVQMQWNDANDDNGTTEGSTLPPEHQRMIDTISADIDILCAMVSGRSPRREHILDLPLLLARPREASNASKADMRHLYNAVHVSNSAHVQQKSDTPPPSSSKDREPGHLGLPVSELRFRNWCIMNELLADAERHDRGWKDAKNEMPKDGQRPDREKLEEVMDVKALRGCTAMGLSDVFRIEGDRVVKREDWKPPGPTMDVETVRRVRGLQSSNLG